MKFLLLRHEPSQEVLGGGEGQAEDAQVHDKIGGVYLLANANDIH